MAFEISNEKFNQYLEEFSQEYDIYAPIRVVGGGRFSETDAIRYGIIEKVEDIEHQVKSEYVPKEAFFPVTETLFNIMGEELVEPKRKDKKKMIFLRACDIHALDRTDTIFLHNGSEVDTYYKSKRDDAVFVLIGCEETFNNCFCVSMGTNKAEDYDLGIKFFDDYIYLEIKNKEFEEVFKEEDLAVDFTPAYVKENNFTINLPDPEKMTLDIFEDDMWDEYTDRCIGCGRCNFSCSTCTCFTTRDIKYDQNPENGERRRVWAGCHVDGFTDIAGGHTFRQPKGARMRFKTMHKIYDFKNRFGKHMCVGCGRCDDRCPEYISFANCINKVADRLEELEGGKNE